MQPGLELVDPLVVPLLVKDDGDVDAEAEGGISFGARLAGGGAQVRGDPLGIEPGVRVAADATDDDGAPGQRAPDVETRAADRPEDLVSPPGGVIQQAFLAAGEPEAEERDQGVEAVLRAPAQKADVIVDIKFFQGFEGWGGHRL